MRKLFGTVSVIAILFLSAATPSLARPSHQPVPRLAPEWAVSEWINSDGVTLSDLKGKVVVDFFQLWCPGCNAFSIPLVKFWGKVFAKKIADACAFSFL